MIPGANVQGRCLSFHVDLVAEPESELLLVTKSWRHLQFCTRCLCVLENQTSPDTKRGCHSKWPFIVVYLTFKGLAWLWRVATRSNGREKTHTHKKKLLHLQFWGWKLRVPNIALHTALPMAEVGVQKRGGSVCMLGWFCKYSMFCGLKRDLKVGNGKRGISRYQQRW